jgi:hypothetical protein
MKMAKFYEDFTVSPRKKKTGPYEPLGRIY